MRETLKPCPLCGRKLEINTDNKPEELIAELTPLESAGIFDRYDLTEYGDIQIMYITYSGHDGGFIPDVKYIKERNDKILLPAVSKGIYRMKYVKSEVEE